MQTTVWCFKILEDTIGRLNMFMIFFIPTFFNLYHKVDLWCGWYPSRLPYLTQTLVMSRLDELLKKKNDSTTHVQVLYLLICEHRHVACLNFFQRRATCILQVVLVAIGSGRLNASVGEREQCMRPSYTHVSLNLGPF